MMVGSASVEALGRNAPEIPAWCATPMRFEAVVCFQLLAELRRGDRTMHLPPGLHPTDPPSISMQAWDVADSPWGAFRFVHARLSCRSGVRARGLTAGAVVTTRQAADGLAATFGFPCQVGSIRLAVHYDGVDLAVDLDGNTVLDVHALDARPLGPDDVQYTGTMNLAHTQNGLRLVQVETQHDTARVQRMRARIDTFRSGAWGREGLDPYDVVAATVAHERSVTIPPVRFVCRPDVSAFEGTERVAGSATQPV